MPTSLPSEELNTAAAPREAAADALHRPILSVRHLAKRFGPTLVLEDIDLDLRPGEIVALMGENGAGKSTLLNLISGALPLESGQLCFDGTPRRWHQPKDALDAGIAVVHQELSVVRALTVAENMFLGDYCARRGMVDFRALRQRAGTLLREIDAGHIRPEAPMNRLRVADQQAVEIAKALRLKLKLLLLDEPTSSLTPHEVEGLFRLLKKLRDRGTSVVFISHRIEEALGLCDRIVVLRDGRLVSDLPVAATNRARIVADMAGREIPAGAARPVTSGGEVVLSAEGLGDGGLVRDVSFTLRKGDILGLFGLVGAGRTELLEMLYGLRPIVTGTLSLHGKPYTPLSPRQAIRAGFALLPEGRKTNGILPFRSVAENITISALPQLSRLGLLHRQGERHVVSKAVKELGIILRDPSQPIRTLSGGNQQKCILSRCLALSPEILLLDEPTHGVDVRTKEQFYVLIRTLAGQGMAIMVVSSEMLELFQLASQILVLSNGRPGGLHQAAGTKPVELMRDAFRHLP